MSNGPLLSGAVTPAHGAAAAAFAWRAGSRGGQLRVTVIAKSTFAFAQGAEMARVAPLPIFAAEVHHDNNPAHSIRYTTDRVPYLRSADVLFTGTGYAARVRIGIFDGGHGGQALLDKTLTVREDGGEPGTPILYERAYGGMTVADNPLGTGAEHGSHPPFILDPNDPSRPAGFGPIARYWPERKHLLGGTPRKALDAPIAEIPEGFDWGYFQASPRDQRVRFLRGDEWLVLDGLHPTLPRVQTRLPGARGLARVHGLSAFGVPEGHPLDLYADLLHIDGDDQQCTVVWRNSFAIAGEGALNEVRIVAGVELKNEPIAWVAPPAREHPSSMASMAATSVLPGEGAAATVLWAEASSTPSAVTALPGDTAPNSAPLPFAPASSPSPLSRPSAPVFKDKRGTGTFAVSPEEEAKAKSAPATPFDPPSGRQPPSPPASIPAAPPPPSIKDRRGVVGTVAVDPTAASHDNSSAPLPFHASSAPSPMAQPSARPAFKDKRGTGTFAVSDDEAIARGVKALPFMAKAAEAKEEPAPHDRGGSGASEPAPAPIEVPAIDIPPPPQAAPAPKPAEPPRPKEAQWAPQPAAAPPAPPKPAPAQIGPTAATAAPKRGLYDRFNKR